MTLKTTLGAAAVALGLAALAVPADAALITTGSSAVVANFSQPVGGQPNLTGSITFSNFVVSGTTATFNVAVQNTTSAAFPEARLVGFAFDTNPDPTGVSDNSGIYTSLLNQNFPGGFQTVDVCFISGAGNNCSGGANGGLTSGQSTSFGVTLTFASAQTSFLLGQNSPTDPEEFAIRFQTGVGSYTFGNTTTTPIPEPGSLALLGGGLIGLGVVARRRRRADATA